MNFERSEIGQILNACIDELFERDLCLLTNNVSERAITHKLAEYLQVQIPWLNVDCEYNRNALLGANEPKKIFVLKGQTQECRRHYIDSEEDLLSISTYPDIIVHRRMTNDENLLVVEVKKSNSRVNHCHDYDKLKAFTEDTDQNSYHFRYGVFMVLEMGHKDPGKPTLTWFMNGELQQ